MDSEEFRKFGKKAADYIGNYLDNLRERKVLPSVEPGYLQRLLPTETPQKGESWEIILQDVDRLITPGLTHWHSPNFHAFYPTANSFPGIVGELMLAGLATISTDSVSDNVSVSLESKMLDWLAKLLNLPQHFLNSRRGPGGGLIQNAASESTLIALLAAKTQKTQTFGKLVAYTSEESNSSVEKAGLLASITMRLLPTDETGSLRGRTLLAAIHEDLNSGFVPCCVIATFGTTGTCAFDNLAEIGVICEEFKVWLHVDAAYAGAALCCPEYQPLIKGIELADSFSVNPHKWMLVNTDCSAMWMRDTRLVEKIFNPTSSIVPEIKSWQIPETRRFRALKLWFVLRIYGIQGVRSHIRKQIALAKYFEGLVRKDPRFEVCTASMGLVCFRLRGGDSDTQELLDKVTQRRLIFVMPHLYRAMLVIRFVICSRLTEEKDVLFAWEEIKSQTQATIGN